MLLQAAKYIGAGLATIGLAGAGVGIGTGASEKNIFLIMILSKKCTRMLNLEYFVCDILLQLYNFLFIEVTTFLYKVWSVWTLLINIFNFKSINTVVGFVVSWKSIGLRFNFFKQALSKLKMYFFYIALKLHLSHSLVKSHILFVQRLSLERSQTRVLKTVEQELLHTNILYNIKQVSIHDANNGWILNCWLWPMA